MESNSNYNFWNKNEHLKKFSFWLNLKNFYFNWLYGNFQEQRYLIKCLNRENKKQLSILDVGCATATTLRYLNNKKITNYNYTGVDISKVMINFCRKKYKNQNFFKIKPNQNLKLKLKKKFDVVYSRDTVMHQTDPLKFIKNLIDITEKYLILRLRTRDVGKTEFNYKISCQKHYGNNWAPYIVINTKELINYLKNSSKIYKITLNHSYQVLGGVNERYLPKELYLDQTKGAETTILIEKTNQKIKKKIIKFELDLEGHLFQFKHKYLNFFLMLLNKFLNKIFKI